MYIISLVYKASPKEVINLKQYNIIHEELLNLILKNKGKPLNIKLITKN